MEKIDNVNYDDYKYKSYIWKEDGRHKIPEKRKKTKPQKPEKRRVVKAEKCCLAGGVRRLHDTFVLLTYVRSRNPFRKRKRDEFLSKEQKHRLRKVLRRVLRRVFGRKPCKNFRRRGAHVGRGGLYNLR